MTRGFGGNLAHLDGPEEHADHTMPDLLEQSILLSSDHEYSKSNKVTNDVITMEQNDGKDRNNTKNG